jgi:hypothetical protein
MGHHDCYNLLVYAIIHVSGVTIIPPPLPEGGQYILEACASTSNVENIALALEYGVQSSRYINFWFSGYRPIPSYIVLWM